MPAMENVPIPRTQNRPLRKPLATQRLRYVGDPVAVIVAENLAVALDAHDLVEIDYVPLPAAVDPEEALAPDAPMLYEEFGSNLAFNTQIDAGDIDAAFAQATHVTHLRVVNQRVAPSSFGSGAHLAVVEIDVETGEIHILQYVAVDDSGNVLSHHLADAQIHGGLAQGIGQALYEETIYSQDGQVLSATLMDYTLPNAEQIPVFQTAFKVY